MNAEIMINRKQNAKVLVSVIIPTWNRGKFLKEAVESVLKQTEHSIEVLVCDDGSDDNSSDLIKDIGDGRVHWLPGVRTGLPGPTRNRGIRNASGEWVAFLDSDDTWFPHKLEFQLRIAKTFNVLAVSSNAKRFSPITGYSDGPLIDYSKDRITLNDLLSINWVICSSMLVHSSVIPILEGFPEDTKFRAIEDYAFWMRVATLTDIAYIADPLLCYRDDPGASIRAIETLEESELRKRVFGNYLYWCLRSNNKKCLRLFSKITLFWLKNIVQQKLLI